MDTIQQLVRFYKALGDETRLRLIVLLSQQEPGGAMCVGRLARDLETTISNVSQHLRVLKDLGLVCSERRGRRIHYSLDTAQVAYYRTLTRELLGAPFAVEVGSE
jgi:DNA-binding transcriptional ArsR family regulator